MQETNLEPIEVRFVIDSPFKVVSLMIFFFVLFLLLFILGLK